MPDEAEAALEPRPPTVATDREQAATEPTPADESSADRDSEPELYPPGNPQRPMGLLVALGGALPVFLLMASDVHSAVAVPIGFLGCLVAALGLLYFAGTFDDRDAEVRGSTSLAALAPRLVELVASTGASIAALRLAVAGVLPAPIVTSALLVTSFALWTVVAVFRLGRALGVWILDEDGVERGLLQRHGFWLIALNLVISLPLLGSFSLSDPWETHYGEVAREMLVRDDWISLWWAQDGWFWSKPVLDFWLQGLFFSLLGVRYLPDQMLAGVERGHFPSPEWAARLPILILSVLAIYLVYKAVARVFGRRAGFLSGLVLSTTPYWYFLTHQSMTDMPYVAPMTAAVALIALGMRSNPEKRVPVYELRAGEHTFRLSAFHLLFAVVLVTVVPQILYLASRNVTLQLAATPLGFRWHLDEFFAGSGGGNCGLPGNEACRWAEPVNALFQPALMAVVWAVIAFTLLSINRGERREQRLYFLGAWYMTALAALAKGAPGLVLPLLVGLCALGAARRFRDFTRFELLGLALLIGCVCLPWYVQMYMRHGPQFTDRLLFHDMYKRAFVHVHDTNTGDDVSFRYYVWQLGYGLFPWTGLAAAGLAWWLKFKDEADDARSELMALTGLWLVISFSMFTISLTKFHHYVLPAVPPIAILTGVFLDRALGAGSSRTLPRLPYLGGIAAAAALLVYGAFRLTDGSLSGRVLAQNVPPPASLSQALLALAAGLGLWIVIARRFAPKPTDGDELPAEADGTASHHRLVLGTLGFLAAIPVLLVGRDLATEIGSEAGQARLLHLFTYNYKRPWPDTLDFNAVLLGFTIVFAGLCALFFVPRLRAHAATMACAVGLLWSAWGVNVYLVEAAPHWGQRETMMTYYTTRRGPEEPLVAYQMNWKGENFYTGNRVPAFVSSGVKFKNWLTEQREKGVKVMFFTTEHSRLSSLKSELGTVKKFETLTDKALNNKFFLARVEL